jgi:hypothetical protein
MRLGIPQSGSLAKLYLSPQGKFLKSLLPNQAGKDMNVNMNVNMNFNQIESTDYHCYLLRLQRDGEQRPWRASLQCSSTGTLHHFANVVHLIAFLQAQTGGVGELAANDLAVNEPGQAE